MLGIGAMHSLDTIAGVLLGTAIGDALGLPHEGLGPERIARRLRSRPLQHCLLPGRGLLSDDTEHTAMIARALSESGGDVERFTRSFARQLKRWVVGLPPGIGFATLRGALRLLFGVRPGQSGVPSAGNGPAMRAAIVGVCAKSDDHLVDLVRASTRITHSDPRAEDGAIVVARLARQLASTRLDPSIIDEIRDDDFRARVRHAWTGEYGGFDEYRASAGYDNGVSGFIVHTVPAAIFCALQTSAGVRSAFERAIRLGGDTDTTAAIVGGLLGARHGASGLPPDWIAGVRDWPVSTATLWDLATALFSGRPPPPQRWIAALPRNLGVTALLFAHVTLRLFGR